MYCKSTIPLKAICVLGYNEFDFFKENEQYRPCDGCKIFLSSAGIGPFISLVSRNEAVIILLYNNRKERKVAECT